MRKHWPCYYSWMNIFTRMLFRFCPPYRRYVAKKMKRLLEETLFQPPIIMDLKGILPQDPKNERNDATNDRC